MARGSQRIPGARARTAIAPPGRPRHKHHLVPREVERYGVLFKFHQCIDRACPGENGKPYYRVYDMERVAPSPYDTAYFEAKGGGVK